MEKIITEKILDLKGKKVLVMFSGGKDSALCLALLNKYGVNVEAIHFKHKWGWNLSTEEAKRIAKILKVNIKIVDYSKELKRRLRGFRDGRPCKICKPGMYIETLKYAKENDFSYICIGDNAADTIVNRIRDYEGGKKDLYFSNYLDCINEGVKIPKKIKIFRPLINIPPKEVERILYQDFKIKIKRNHETGDKYYEYWREGCPLQYNDAGSLINSKRMNDLHKYNSIAANLAKKGGFRASVHLPSTRIVTIPKGHEWEIRKALLKEGLKLKTPNLKKERPLIEHFIIEVYGVDSKLLRKCKDTLPLVNRFIERARLKVVNKIHHDFKPFGNTMVFVLSNSHLAIHTWPEFGFIHFDLLSCKEFKNTSSLKNIIFEIFKTYNFRIRKEEY